MRNPIRSDLFSARRDIVLALWSISSGVDGHHELKQIASELDSLSVALSSTSAANAYAAFAGLVRVVDALVHWRTAVLEGTLDADRFLRSARERHTLWLDEYREQSSANKMVSAAAAISDINQIAHVLPIVRSIALIPLPVGVFESQKVRLTSHSQVDDSPEDQKLQPEDLTIAFLKFQINGQPAVALQNLAPGEVHDLEIEVRVSRWPAEQTELRLTPISVEPKSTYDFPVFSFTKPAGTAPYILHQRGRAVVLLPQGMHARPFEFKYTAEFLLERGEQPVAVVGHRTLLIEGIDVSKFQICGYPVLDRKLFEIRDTLRRRSAVPQDETADALLVLAPLCNVAGRAVQDAEFPGSWTESQFQSQLRKELRRNTLIGAHLDEHANGGGGITDLSLRGMPIELKVVKNLVTDVGDCERYFAQTASYAVAKGKHTGILCVLDSSEKTTSSRSIDDLLGLQLHEDSGVMICVIVIQGNLAKPSALSR